MDPGMAHSMQVAARSYKGFYGLPPVGETTPAAGLRAWGQAGWLLMTACKHIPTACSPVHCLGCWGDVQVSSTLATRILVISFQHSTGLCVSLTILSSRGTFSVAACNLSRSYHVGMR